jgi:DNA primase
MPKWKNTREYPRRETLFNWDRVKASPDVIVVEAAVSVIWLWQCGVHNAVATFGTKFSSEQVDMLRGFDNVTIWYDADPAGWGNAVKLCEALSGHTNVWVVDSWEGDANEHTPEECRAALLDGSLIPGYLYRSVLRERLSKEDYYGVYQIWSTRAAADRKGNGGGEA